ncbi:MAG: hypothetical protein K8U03_24945 [Planctomycetia bacterium]|nr:hypothetical protein [Planctomycetia bacterium]
MPDANRLAVHYFACASDEHPWRVFFRTDRLSAAECDTLLSALRIYLGEYHKDEDVTIEAVSAVSEPARFLDLAHSWKLYEEHELGSWDDNTRGSLYDIACEHETTLIEIRADERVVSYLTADFGSGIQEVFNRIDSLSEDEQCGLDSVLDDEVHQQGGCYERFDEFSARGDHGLWLRLSIEWEDLEKRTKQNDLTEFEEWATARSNALVDRLLQLRKLPRPKSSGDDETEFDDEDEEDSPTEVAPIAVRPDWRPTDGELRFGDKLARRVRPLAKNVIAILTAFEEDGWPTRIDDPLPGGRDDERLRSAVRSLNDGLGLIQFEADGSGEGIRWKRVEQASEAGPVGP